VLVRCQGDSGALRWLDPDHLVFASLAGCPLWSVFISYVGSD